MSTPASLSSPRGSRLHRACRLIALPLLLLAASLSTGVGCSSTAPVTGRSQITMVSDGEMLQLSQEEYSKVKGDAKLITRGPAYDQVVRVGRRIAQAAETFNRQSGQPQQFAWEFSLIDDSEMINAWCMPGGKIAVYTGIMALTRSDDDLAVIMGHEVAHALARHANERMSHAMIVQAGTAVAASALAQDNPRNAELFAIAAGAGAQYGHMLPFGRKQELEADRIGLILMANAGYNQRVAPDFWRRMSAVNQGGSPPEWMSTHPADGRRIQDLEAGMPEAIRIYEGTR